MILTDFTPGMRVWVPKYATEGTVDHPAIKKVHLVLDGETRVRAMLPCELQCAKPAPAVIVPRTTRTYRHPVKPELNARQRRAMRNGAARYATGLVTAS